MSKIKIIFIIIIGFILYKGFVAIKDFNIGVGSRVAMIEEQAGFEKEGEVIGLMMYLDGRTTRTSFNLIKIKMFENEGNCRRNLLCRL